ncbi:MAG TPA: hypothetical protein VGF71_00575, partial [Caulobacteraceae bacterium]
YVGVTADLITRVVQHRDGEVPGFTATYGLKRLVWFEPHETIVGAIQREKDPQEVQTGLEEQSDRSSRSPLGGPLQKVVVAPAMRGHALAWPTHVPRSWVAGTSPAMTVVVGAAVSNRPGSRGGACAEEGRWLSFVKLRKEIAYQARQSGG